MSPDNITIPPSYTLESPPLLPLPRAHLDMPPHACRCNPSTIRAEVHPTHPPCIMPGVLLKGCDFLYIPQYNTTTAVSCARGGVYGGTQRGSMHTYKGVACVHKNKTNATYSADAYTYRHRKTPQRGGSQCLCMVQCCCWCTSEPLCAWSADSMWDATCSIPRDTPASHARCWSRKLHSCTSPVAVPTSTCSSLASKHAAVTST